jgi:hypothetical protein
MQTPLRLAWMVLPWIEGFVIGQEHRNGPLFLLFRSRDATCPFSR